MYPDKLYQLAFAFRKAKLWKSLYDSELFAVTLPDGEIGYCCVMGAAGEHLALALYVGSSGLDSYRLLQEVGDMDVSPLKASEIMLSQDCLQCSFENKDMLTPEELSALTPRCTGLPSGEPTHSRSLWAIIRPLIHGLSPIRARSDFSAPRWRPRWRLASA